MKLNKKGFTLIELLAVIVVLAILLVIAVPRVLDVIESARKESLGKSTQIVAKYLKQQYAIEMVKGSTPPTSTTGFANDCPDEAGFNEPSEGDCQYDVTVSGSDASFSVKITGAGRFSGWVATSNDGGNATVEAPPEGPFVQDVVAIGDYIDYDAGNWTSTVAMPAAQGNYGGYVSGNSKNQGLACESAGALVSGRIGWRVMNINSTTGVVSIIHVGTPECYYHSADATYSIPNLLGRDYSYYVDATFATSAEILTKETAEILNGASITYGMDILNVLTKDQLLRSGSHYYFPTVYNTTYLFYVQSGGWVGGARYNAYGIRPVVKLKTNLYIDGGTGTSADKYGISTTKQLNPN